MSDNDNISLVFEGSSPDADFVENILKDSGISTFIKNKNMGQLFPYYASHGGIQPVKIFVQNSDLENATGIINAYFDSNL